MCVGEVGSTSAQQQWPKGGVCPQHRDTDAGPPGSEQNPSTSHGALSYPLSPGASVSPVKSVTNSPESVGRREREHFGLCLAHNGSL